MKQNNEGGFCPYCGRQLERGSRFCAGCGAVQPGNTGSGYAGNVGTSSDVLKIICLISAILCQGSAISAISYFSHYFMSDRIWGLCMFAAGVWNVLILAMIGLKCDRRYGKNMMCALVGGSAVKTILHVIRLIRVSGVYFYYIISGVTDILAIVITIVMTGVICYLMSRDGMLAGNNGETLGQTLHDIPQALKQMLDLNLNKNSGKNYNSVKSGFVETTPIERLRTILSSELFFIFVCVYTFDLVFRLHSGFAWLNALSNIFPLLVCSGLMLIFYSNNWKDNIDDGGFFLINITLSFNFYGGIVGAVIIAILMLIATIAIGSYMLIADLIAAVILFLRIYFWWTLKKTVDSMRGVARGTENVLYSSVYPIVILGIQAVYKVGKFIWACVMQIAASGLMYAVDQYGNSTSDMLNEILRELGIGYGDTSGLTRMITEPVNSWIQGILGFAQNPIIMLIGISVPILEIMLLLRIRSYKNA